MQKNINILEESACLDAERAILGAVLIDEQIFGHLKDKLHSSDFYDPRNQKIWAAFCELSSHGMHIDLVLAVDALKKKGSLEQITVHYIASLAGDVITTKNIDYYAGILRKRALERTLKKVLVEAAQSPSDENLRSVMTGIEALKAFRDGTKLLELPSSLDILNLDTDIQWVIEGLIPKGAITLLYGKGGIGKTWLALQIAKGTADGLSVFDLLTKKVTAVYVDFENPLPLVKQRLEILGASDDFLYWHLGNDPSPPRLDGKNWRLYKQLPKDSLIIFDTLRAAQRGDENSSQDMAAIMGRLKELREAGYTIVALHHTPKSNEAIYKGSTAIIDLIDHGLCLEKLREDEENLSLEMGTFKLGTKDKTRYEPVHLFLKFDPGKGFVYAPDPDREAMRNLYDLIIDLKEIAEEPPNQSRIIEKAKELGLTANAVRRLLKKGEGACWHSLKLPEKKNALIYRPNAVFQFSNTIYKRKTEKQKSPEINEFFNNASSKDSPKDINSPEFSSFSKGPQTTKKQDRFEYEI